MESDGQILVIQFPIDSKENPFDLSCDECRILWHGNYGSLQADYQALDKTAIALLRSLMRGEATWEGSSHKQSLTNDQVWKRCYS